MNDQQGIEVFDTTGEKCVKMLLKIRARVNQLEPGQRLLVLSDDPVSIYDLPAWCHMTQHAYFGYERDGDVYKHTVGVIEDSIKATTDKVWAPPTH